MTRDLTNLRVISDGEALTILEATVDWGSGTVLPHRFAVIWDGDHDERILDFVDALAATEVMATFLAFHEHEGHLTIVLSIYGAAHSESELAQLEPTIEKVKEASVPDDWWTWGYASWRTFWAPPQVPGRLYTGQEAVPEESALRRAVTDWELG